LTTGYRIWISGELEGAQLDLETTTDVTGEEEVLLQALVYDQRGHTFHRLENDWQGHKAGTLVLYDGQEVMVFLAGAETAVR
jgi:AraC-like DNA-binding protein